MASLEIRNGVYHLRWRDKRGRSRSQSTGIHTSPANDKLALKRLANFERELKLGKEPGAPLSISAMLDDVIRDYTTNARKSAAITEQRIAKHLRSWFGTMRAERFGADDWREYQTHRQTQGASNGTINRERAILVRGFTLAVQSGRLDVKPYVPRLSEAAPRVGFIDRAELDALCRHLPDYLASFTRFAFLTGWRLGEIRQLQWRHVDFVRGEIRLDPGTTKNGEGRVFPMTQELRTLLESLTQTSGPAAVSPTSSVNVVVDASMTANASIKAVVTPLVFHLNGAPVGWIYASWKKAAKAIGKPGLLFHDLRRSFVREQRLNGMSEAETMLLSGHKTRAVFDNYNVIGQQDLERLREIMEGPTHGKSPQSGKRYNESR